MASLLQMDIKDLFSRKNKDKPNKSKENKTIGLDKTVIMRIIYASVLIILLAIYFLYKAYIK